MSSSSFSYCIVICHSTNLTVIVTLITIIVVIIAVLTLILFIPDFTSSNCYDSSASVGQELSHRLLQALLHLILSVDKVPCSSPTKAEVKEDICGAFTSSTVLFPGGFDLSSFLPQLVGHC